MTDFHADRPDKLRDLTRWNRAGLSRFEYVDGDASVWLEELRIALLGHYMRGAPAETRMPEAWRDAFLRDPVDWPDAMAAKAQVVWQRLAPELPPVQDTRGRRNTRLLEQYDTQTEDYAWEIMRAFARASHVLLGTLDAYTNEGYLRTATQWDNLRRLASMVNYQPTPPASATSTVALQLKQGSGLVEIAPGLAMKYTPAEGGAPLIFETHEKIAAHPDLSAARTEDWNVNAERLSFASGKVKDAGQNPQGMRRAETPEPAPRAITWHCPQKQTLAPGDLVVVSDGALGHASVIAKVAQNEVEETARVVLTDVPSGDFTHHSTRLWRQPLDVRVALPETKPSKSILKTDASSYLAGDLVRVTFGRETDTFEVLEASGDELVVDADLAAYADVQITPMVAYSATKGDYIADEAITTMYFKMRSGIRAVDARDRRSVPYAKSNQFVPDETPRDAKGYVIDKTMRPTKVAVKPAKPEVLPETQKKLGAKTVSFAGKPPKGLAEGDWFAVRDLTNNSLSALQVAAMRVGSDAYHLVLSRELTAAPEESEFHGPLQAALPALNHDRNPEAALQGGQVTLEAIAPEASQLVKPGRKMIITRTRADRSESLLVTVAEVISRAASKLEMVIDPIDAARGWAKGDTTFQLNAVEISHGETKGAKLLGSGDGERSRQSFTFAIKNVSLVPSAVSETGVVPALDVVVDDTLWRYRDYIDASAEGTRAWSTTLQDDGTLVVHFRRRLVTGQNNIRILRHRVGAGVIGSNIPAFSFEKPLKKDRFVEAIVQPFPTAGGADREPVSKLRVSAPARLSANGRAVSLQDFEGLAVRHASVLQAHAEERPAPGATRMVQLTLAPVGGGAITQTLENDLRAAILGKAVPGTSLFFKPYETLPLNIGVRVRADLTVHDRSELKAAAEEKLTQTFSIEARRFGQTTYVSEVLAALETVAGIETALTTRFDLGDAYDLLKPKPAHFTRPWPRNVATRDGAVAAIYATDHQIAFLPPGDATRIAVVVEDIR
ncbi:hypothetical protein J7413_14445 [Shimia sp. R10_1]|uniref:hypothetical protein n=1 Tax=Shimia sp. R10_1 TaxID=2821095 RepID=UPI001ADCBC87|nr:hypothetical protein [Shimia sp. R10_1]MBO9474746.1 hypothetical protein [Shimia sp. R10_1]